MRYLQRSCRQLSLGLYGGKAFRSPKGNRQTVRAVLEACDFSRVRLHTEFVNQDYDSIKKVYSIWICMDTPEDAADSITKYSIHQTPVAGNFKGEARYDLMTGIMVCLGKKVSGEENSLFRLLGTILSAELKPEQKKKVMEMEYDIRMSQKVEEAINVMCNLSDLVEEKAIEKGIEKGIAEGGLLMLIRLVENGKIDIMDAAMEADMSVEKFKRCMENKKK